MNLGFVVISSSIFAVVLTNSITITLLSDVHYDPRYGTEDAFGRCRTAASSSFGNSGCDAPLELVTSAINDAAAQDTDVMLMSGDWLRHGFNYLPLSAAIPAFETVASLLKDAAPANSVLAIPNFQGALGNNDFVPDYHFNLSHDAHPLLLNQSYVLGNLSLLTETEVNQFAKCGYYFRDVRNTSTGAPLGLRVVVLNTVMWCTFLDPPLALNNTDPCMQFQFLETTLADTKAQGMQAYVVAHIPPGLNLYNVLHDGLNGTADSRQFWREDFVRSYIATVGKYKDTVAAQFFGHTHQFSFIADEELGVPGFIAPSITRLFGNNPSYLIFEVDTGTWKVTDIRQRFLDIQSTTTATWTEGQRLSNVFGGNSFGSVGGILGGTTALTVNSTQWSLFQEIHEGGIIVNMFPTPPGSSAPNISGSCNDMCKRIVKCSMEYVAWSTASACCAVTTSGGANKPQFSVGMIVVYVACAVIGLAVITVAGRFVKDKVWQQGGEAMPLNTDEKDVEKV